MVIIEGKGRPCPAIPDSGDADPWRIGLPQTGWLTVLRRWRGSRNERRLVRIG